MISNINDISYFLDILSRYRTKNGIRKNTLYTLIDIPPSLLVYPFDYEQVFDFCICLNLLHERQGIVTLTNHGMSIADMEQTGLDLTDEQKQYIIINCIFNNKKFSNLKNLLIEFVFHEKLNSFVISEEKTIKYQNEISLLVQFNVIHKQNKLWVIESKFLDYIEQIRKRVSKIITQKQLDEILAEQKQIGNMAEELTVKYESERLKKRKLTFESNNVRKISDEYVNRGYDVESFSTKSKKPNLFIEVKGRKYNNPSFIISINEIKAAEVLGNQYAIYFWSGLGSAIPPKKPSAIIRNPFKKLFLEECKNCLSFLVEIKRM